jgi:hypothetical protein
MNILIMKHRPVDYGFDDESWKRRMNSNYHKAKKHCADIYYRFFVFVLTMVVLT